MAELGWIFEMVFEKGSATIDSTAQTGNLECSACLHTQCTIPHSSAATYEAKFDEHGQELAERRKEGSQLIYLLRQIGAAVVFELRILRQASNYAHILFADKLICHKNARDAVTVHNLGLVCRGQCNSLRAML